MSTRPQATGHRPQERPEARGQGPEEGKSIPDSRFPIPANHDARFTIHELEKWGEEFGRKLKAPALVTLDGELGAGKTTLAQAICRGVGIREDVTSPTFALVHEHHVDGTTVYHLDLYRLNSPDDLTNLAWDDIINSGEIVLVEWADRAGARLPPDAFRIRLEHIAGEDDRRRLRVD